MDVFTYSCLNPRYYGKSWYLCFGDINEDYLKLYTYNDLYLFRKFCRARSNCVFDDVMTCSALLGFYDRDPSTDHWRSSLTNDQKCTALIFPLSFFNKLLNKQPCCRWFEASWRSHDVTAMQWSFMADYKVKRAQVNSPSLGFILKVWFISIWIYPPPSKFNNNKHVYRQSQVRKPIDSEFKWAECSLIIGTGCWVQVFSSILDSSVGLWVGIQSAGELVSETSQLWILHSAEEDNLSPFDSKIACLYQSIEINNKHIKYQLVASYAVYVFSWQFCAWTPTPCWFIVITNTAVGLYSWVSRMAFMKSQQARRWRSRSTICDINWENLKLDV